MDKNIIFLLTYCEADEWIKFTPPSKFKEKFSKKFLCRLDSHPHGQGIETDGTKAN